MTRPDGSFLPSRTMRLRALARRLPRDRLERELTAQIELVRGSGVPVSHVDSHRHLHKLGSVQAALARVLRASVSSASGTSRTHLPEPPADERHLLARPAVASRGRAPRRDDDPLLHADGA